MPNNASNKHTSKPLSFSQKYRFWLFLLAAFALHQVPFISVPFKWLESYFHEISHGLAALLTGGKIVQIELFPNGAGLCTTRGGWNFIISFMGYAGATLWGVLIYKLASMQQRLVILFSSLLILLLLSSIVLWVRDLLTLSIVGVILVLFVLPFKLNKLQYLQPLLQLSGVLILLNSLYSPTYLFAYNRQGDSAALANMTGLPEFIWVLLWLLLALFSMFLLGKKPTR